MGVAAPRPRRPADQRLRNGRRAPARPLGRRHLPLAELHDLCVRPRPGSSTGRLELRSDFLRPSQWLAFVLPAAPTSPRRSIVPWLGSTSSTPHSRLGDYRADFPAGVPLLPSTSTAVDLEPGEDDPEASRSTGAAA